MHRKSMIRLFTGVIAAVLLAGCGKNEDSVSSNGSPSAATESETKEPEGQKEEQVLTVAALENGYGADMWTKAAAAFEDSHPGVTVELMTDRNLEDIVIPGMRVGMYPDVVCLTTGREAGLTETLTREKALLPLTDVLDGKIPGENKTVREKVIPKFLDTPGTNPYGNDVTYYAPVFYRPCGLFYNAGLFREKGWDVPDTWDEMWVLGDKAKEDGIALFTYSEKEDFTSFFYALLYSLGGNDFYHKCIKYEDGIWEGSEAKKVFEIMEKLAEYTENTTLEDTDEEAFAENEQLIFEKKAFFCPSSTWVQSSLTDGFEWGFMAIPAADEGEKGSIFISFEQLWIPTQAANPDLAKEFAAYLYSDEAAEIFAESAAVQPIVGMDDLLEGDLKLFYDIEDDAQEVMDRFAAVDTIDSVSMTDTLFEMMNGMVNGDKTAAECQVSLEEVSDQLRAMMH